MNSNAKWKGIVFMLLGMVLGWWGYEAISQAGWSVSGGPIIWVLYFGGSLIFFACGIQIFLKSWRSPKAEK